MSSNSRFTQNIQPNRYSADYTNIHDRLFHEGQARQQEVAQEVRKFMTLLVIFTDEDFFCSFLSVQI